jgi:hypothetical protein
MSGEEDVDLPSPARRIVLETNPLFYPFGNTPARNLLEGRDVNHPCQVSAFSALILGLTSLERFQTHFIRSKGCGCMYTG